jgi:hypothetical protein
LEDQSFDGIIEDAVFLRMLLGEGQLPLVPILHAVSDRVPISLEIRSRTLNEQFPNLQDRANTVFESTLRFLDTLNTNGVRSRETP